MVIGGSFANRTKKSLSMYVGKTMAQPTYDKHHFPKQ